MLQWRAWVVELRSIIIMVLCCISPAGSKIVIFVACVFFFSGISRILPNVLYFLAFAHANFPRILLVNRHFIYWYSTAFFFCARANTKNRGQWAKSRFLINIISIRTLFILPEEPGFCQMPVISRNFAPWQ